MIPDKIKDFQVFIPGWNVIYMIKEYRRGNKEEAQKERDSNSRLLELMLTAETYIAQRDDALNHGELDRAKGLDNKIADVVLSYLK